MQNKLTQKEKSKFRSSKEWKQFRVDLLQERNCTCDLCLRTLPSPKIHIHHKDLNSENYTNIENKSHFALLCKNCHDYAHSYYSILNNKKNKNKNWKIFETIQHLFLWSDELMNMYKNSKNK